MMSLTFGLFTQVSGSGPLGPLVKIFRMVTKIDFNFLRIFGWYLKLVRKHLLLV